MTVPDITVEIAFASQANPAAWTLGVSAFPTTFGSATIYVWTDVTSYVRGMTITRGKQRELDAYGIGRCNVHFRNTERAFDPLNLSGPFVSAGATQIVPGKPIRVTAVDPVSGLTYYLFRGTIRNWGLDYSGDFNAVTTAQATDSMDDLTKIPVSLTTSAGLSGQAVEAVLVDAGVGLYAADTGVASLQAMTFTGTASAALRVIEQTEQGHVFGEVEGGVAFHDRHVFFNSSRSLTSQKTFGGSGLAYETPDRSYDSDNIKNHAQVTRQGGTKQDATNAASVALYGEQVISLTGMANATDTDALGLATYLTTFRANPAVRTLALAIAANNSNALMAAAVTTRLLDRVTISFTPPGAASANTKDAFVIGIEHSWSANTLKTTFRFMPTDSAELAWRIGVGAFGVTTGVTATAFAY
jgi:hypothetical protein